MDARVDTQPFSFAGHDHNGNPLDMLLDAKDGLWAAVYMVEATENHDPPPTALHGLACLLQGLAATVESAYEILDREPKDDPA